MNLFASQHDLMPWHEVATVYNQRTGERLSRNQVWHIAQKAEAKLRDALRDLAVEECILSPSRGVDS